MSRNFELLTQLESEIKDQERRPKAEPKFRTAETAMPMEEERDNGLDEMERLVQSLFLTPGRALRQVVFCGVDGESGSSFVCADAGRMLAVKTSKSVCLIDANTRTPRLSGLFGVNMPTPFSDHEVTVRERCISVGGDLWLAGASALGGNNGAFPAEHELKERLAQLRAEFDYLLIDVAGTNVSGDAALLGRTAGAVILVIEANSTRRISARKAQMTLDRADAHLLGTVLRGRTSQVA